MSYKGGCRAEFGIIEDFDYENDYSKTYEPLRYNCVAICDDALNDWRERLTEMPSYFHSYKRLHEQGIYGSHTALDRWGVTLIPPASLDLLIDVIKTETQAEFYADAMEIIELLEEAKTRDKFVIHYGV